jgi:hypothetical protein
VRGVHGRERSGRFSCQTGTARRGSTLER